jgi:DNA-binding CsgD family transcriptional regulator
VAFVLPLQSGGEPDMRAAVQVRGSVDFEGVLRVIDRAYAAACDETPWDRFVAELVRLGGFGGCALGSIDPLAPPPVLRAAYGLRDLARAGSEADRMPRNPLLTDEVLRSPPGTLWHDRQVIAPPLLAATRFWADWMEPNGFASWACIILGRERTEVAYLEVYGRPGGPSTGCDRNGLLGQLAPHLTRAWRLGKAGRAAPGAARLSIVPSPTSKAASDPAGMPAVVQLRAQFGLTKAEARLALSLAAGASLPSMAQAFDVKLTTVRSQLQQVFAKTGTSRQAELVAVLLSHGYADPTAGRFAPPPVAAGQRSGEGPERLSA